MRHRGRSLEGRPVERELVEAMNARIVHRGPDEDGFWFGAGLAMRRLSSRIRSTEKAMS